MRISDWSSDVCSSDLQRRDQAFARGISEVVINQRIAVDVDLRSQLTVFIRRHEEMYVRGAVAVATEFIQQRLGRAVGRATVTFGKGALELITALIIGNYGAAHIERLLLAGGVEVRVKAFGVALPTLDLGPRNRLAISSKHRIEIGRAHV